MHNVAQVEYKVAVSITDNTSTDGLGYLTFKWMVPKLPLTLEH